MKTPLSVLLVALMMCVHHVSTAQDVPVSNILGDYFAEFEMSKVDKRNLKSSDGTLTLNLKIDDKASLSLHLSRTSILSSNHTVKLSSGQRFLEEKDLGISYAGRVLGNEASSARITVHDDFVYGSVSIDGKKYFVEPAQRFDPSLAPDLMVTYQSTNVKKVKKITCASQHEADQKKKIDRQLKAAGSCQLVDVAIALDWSYVQDHGGSTGAINQSIAVLNMVAGSYEGAFSDDIRFEIVEHFVSDCNTCDPWTASTNANILLDGFTAWGPSGFSNSHDVGQLWTNRNLCDNTGACGVAGLAWVGALCSPQRYLILEDFTTTAWQLRVLVAHELGHMFGASHDAAGSAHIMAPSIVSNTETWSAASINTINADLPGYACIEECVIGSCTEITNISTSGCTPGNPSTYTLTLEIRHGGGGTSSSFDVLLDGSSYNYTWGTSPQTVVITGLTADGIQGKSITIAADDGSDTGCAGASTFDTPTADCSIHIEENFDGCSLPSGWNATSTNIYTWNGGDPLAQYQWKFDDATRQFANYDDQSNSSSLKTIDGTCMALMDDDIINHSLYTGVVTLTSAAYDVSSVDTLKLKFDYNFHPFEDGGKGDNNSYFETEVFNGSEWISILYDDNSDCSWHDVWPPSCAEAVDLDLSVHINDDFAIRFIYSDGNDAKWTGMIALDNIEISGTVEVPSASCEDGVQNGDETGIDCGGPCAPCPDPCQDVVVVTDQNVNQMNEARNLIKTSGPITLTQETMFAADSVVLDINFEVGEGNNFTIMNDGCE